ncbi:MAG: hypothetical protein O3C10_12855, partial [Chloroflexi bacterium]|nr:hypothetical protein [Chloroflexota bacterium]
MKAAVIPGNGRRRLVAQGGLLSLCSTARRDRSLVTLMLSVRPWPASSSLSQKSPQDAIPRRDFSLTLNP